MLQDAIWYCYAVNYLITFFLNLCASVRVNSYLQYINQSTTLAHTPLK